jgi:DNA-binding transcriptional regulator YiaG
MISHQPKSKTNGNAFSAAESAATAVVLLKRKQLARALNASPRSVDNWQKEKKIPVIKISPPP